MEAAIDEPLADAERKALARCRHAVLGVERPLRLDCGVELGPYRVAYQTYGTLNADKSNAVLICHALTLDQFVAEEHPVTGKEGWWESLVGPGKVLDPARYFIICINVLGGCMGTTGPQRPDPRQPAMEPALPGGDRGRHGARPGSPARPSRHPRPVLRDRRLDGRHAGAGMGGELSGASSRPCRSPVRRAIRRRTSPFTRSAARRSWPIPNGRAATIANTTACRAGSRWRA